MGRPARISLSAFQPCGLGGRRRGRPLTDTEKPSVPYKTPWKNYREGTILPVFVCACQSVCLSVPVSLTVPLKASEGSGGAALVDVAEGGVAVHTVLDGTEHYLLGVAHCLQRRHALSYLRGNGGG